jgi:hypothetical protein
MITPTSKFINSNPNQSLNQNLKIKSPMGMKDTWHNGQYIECHLSCNQLSLVIKCWPFQHLTVLSVDHWPTTYPIMTCPKISMWVKACYIGPKWVVESPYWLSKFLKNVLIKLEKKHGSLDLVKLKIIIIIKTYLGVLVLVVIERDFQILSFPFTLRQGT